ncbi:MAG: cyclic nucleotide-binding domain-containing protein [Planctomycetota bacterium]|jgi:CRP-like cAMP-binding protein
MSEIDQIRKRLKTALAAVISKPSDLKARAAMADELTRLQMPEATGVWKATASAAGSRGQFFIALSLARRFLEGELLDELLDELATRYGANRPKKGPICPAPEPEPLDMELPEDDEELAWTAIRIGNDVADLALPKFARMAHIPIFGDLPHDEFMTLAREVQPVLLQPGLTLMQQDVVERSVYLLVNGQAKATTRRPGGGLIDRGVKQGPTVLGEMSLLTEVPRRASVTALGPGMAWKVHADRLVELASSHPELVQRIRELVKARLLGDLFRTSRVLNSLPDKSKVVSAFKVRSIPSGAEVFPQGAPPPGLFFLLHGRAEVWVQAGEDIPARVAELSEGDAFGEMSLLSGEPTTAAIRMPDGGILLHLTVEAFQQLKGDADLEALESGLAELGGVRRGELNEFLAEAEDIEAIEELDDDWVVQEFGPPPIPEE